MRGMRFIVCLLIVFVILPVRAGEVPRLGAIATAHPLATRAGFEILAAGGNAFDAAVAVSAALAVVEPYSSGLGGGGFWLLQRAGETKAAMLDGREVAPQAASRDMYLDAQGNVIPGASVNGPRAAGIPGVPAALDRLAREYGRLPLARSLAPAIRLAERGFTVSEHYRRMAKFRLEVLRASPAAARIFLKDGRVPPLGYRIRQPELAATLRSLAARGRMGFYHGQVARQLVEGVRAAGGIWTLADLRDYETRLREPITGTWRGWRITTAAPPSSGGIALLTMLNILEHDDLARLPDWQRVHLIVEAMRRAYRDRAVYLGDPDFVSIPVARLISKAYAKELRAGIDMNEATPSALLPDPGEASHHTTHFSILDREGNRVAATLSINYPFGSGFVAPGTGVLLNDEMDDFSAKPGVPNVYGLVGAEANAIAPGKRMLSSMTPTFIESDRTLALLGTPGGSRIITMVLLGILALDEGAEARAVVARPRFHHQYLPDVIQFERGALAPPVRKKLEAIGHRLRAFDPWGNMQLVVQHRHSGEMRAASDPRGEGWAEVR